MFQKLRPARSQTIHNPSDGNVKIIHDFDGLIHKRVGFKFHGKKYVLQPVDVENFMKLTLAYQSLLQMIEGRSQGQPISEQDLYQKYYDLIHPLVPDFTFEDLLSLNVVMLNQLVNLCFRQLAGDPSLYEKKNPLTP